MCKRDADIYFILCVVPLFNHNDNNLNHNNTSSRVPNSKNALNKALLLSVHKKNYLQNEFQYI